jgi:hypothetical protein
VCVAVSQVSNRSFSYYNVSLEVSETNSTRINNIFLQRRVPTERTGSPRSFAGHRHVQGDAGGPRGVAGEVRRSPATAVRDAHDEGAPRAEPHRWGGCTAVEFSLTLSQAEFP